LFRPPGLRHWSQLAPGRRYSSAGRIPFDTMGRTAARAVDVLGARMKIIQTVTPRL
jgi:hypothetical protein